MSKKSRELVQRTLEMLILKTLALEPLHGYAIAMRIEQISEGVFRVGPRFAVPRLQPAGKRRAHRLRMACDREPSPCQVPTD